jgi:hypothetical protein
MKNIELHLYLRLDRRQESKRDARVNTSQHEQYGGTVHLFIGTGRSPVKITFMSLMTSYNHDTNYHGLIGLFLFKSVQPFVSRHVTMPKLPGSQLRRVLSHPVLEGKPNANHVRARISYSRTQQLHNMDIITQCSK